MGGHRSPQRVVGVEIATDDGSGPGVIHEISYVGVQSSDVVGAGGINRNQRDIA
jgi:hypothetical protein